MKITYLIFPLIWSYVVRIFQSDQVLACLSIYSTTAIDSVNNTEGPVQAAMCPHHTYTHTYTSPPPQIV